jgi:inosose dehydratase
LRLLERDVDAEFEAMRPHFELLSALGSHVMVCCEVTRCVHGNIDARLAARPQLSPAAFDAFTQRLSALATRMENEGMRLAYHHHMGTVVQTEAEIDALMSACPPSVGLLLDTGHLVFAGGDPARAASSHASRIAHVHCKDIRPDVLKRVLNADTSFLEAVLQGVFTVPGDGCVDYEAVFRPLRATGYEGWLVIEAEQDPAIADPLTYATLGFRTLSALAGRQ